MAGSISVEFSVDAEKLGLPYSLSFYVNLLNSVFPKRIGKIQFEETEGGFSFRGEDAQRWLGEFERDLEVADLEPPAWVESGEYFTRMGVKFVMTELDADELAKIPKITNGYYSRHGFEIYFRGDESGGDLLFRTKGDVLKFVDKFIERAALSDKFLRK
ncbi:MAG: hypothetical protein ACTSU5_06375 [Promethearchaeota archaeon]